MPRVTNTGDDVKQWTEQTGEIPTWWDLWHVGGADHCAL